MLSKEELAQPVGNAKIRGEFDTDTATAVGPNANDAFLFQRSRSDHDGNMTGLSLAGTVLARRYKIMEMIDGDSFKAHDLALDQTVTRLAVRQAALLTYELLGGEKKKDGEVKCWFKPLNGLGDASNSILYRGLQGSPQFESSEDFFYKLESAIRSGAGESRALPAPALQTSKYFAALPGTSDVIRRFNRDTKWLATLVVGALVSAALILAVLLQERHPRADDLTKEARQAEGDLLLNADSATRFIVADFSGKRSTRKMTSGQATSVDHAFTEISPQEDPSSQMEALASTPTSVLAFTPKINRQDVQANASSWTLSHRQDFGRVIGLKVPRASSSVRPRFVDVKMRLIALWHQSLMRTERSRSWTLFSNSNKGDRKKVSYIAKTNH